MFHTKLKEMRQKKGLTQKQMAEILSMATNAYQRYELGTSEPNMLKLLKLSVILDVSLDELLCRDEFLAEHADGH
ncbi:MAG: helix-turn-helix transcriptional regulator [Lachnospiraceae bacterium]